MEPGSLTTVSSMLSATYGTVQALPLLGRPFKSMPQLTSREIAAMFAVGGKYVGRLGNVSG